MHSTCSYTKRALNAQKKGAVGIIIAAPGYSSYKGNTFNGDDGNGKKVQIAVLFISQTDFKKLKNINDLEIKANFPIPKEYKSTLSVFLSASKRSSYIFLRQLKNSYPFISKHITIEPIYHTIICEYCSP